jgi:hypothetical protein
MGLGDGFFTSSKGDTRTGGVSTFHISGDKNAPNHSNLSLSLSYSLPIGSVSLIVLLFLLDLPTPKTSFTEKLKRIDYAGKLDRRRNSFELTIDLPFLCNRRHMYYPCFYYPLFDCNEFGW